MKDSYYYTGEVLDFIQTETKEYITYQTEEGDPTFGELLSSENIG